MPHSPITLMSDYLDSLRRVGALRAPHGLPGHGATFEDVSARADQVIQHQLNRQQQILGLLGSRPQTAHDLAVQVWSGDRRAGAGPASTVGFAATPPCSWPPTSS